MSHATMHPYSVQQTPADVPQTPSSGGPGLNAPLKHSQNQPESSRRVPTESSMTSGPPFYVDPVTHSGTFLDLKSLVFMTD